MAKRAHERPVLADGERDIGEIMDGVRSIVRALRLNTRAIELQLGISLAQLWVLRLLEARAAQSVNELAAATATHQSSVSVVVKRLVDRGLVVRSVAPHDKRRVHVDITDAGRDLLRKAPPTIQVELVGSLRRMAPEPREQLAELMWRWLSDAGLEPGAHPPMLMEEEPGTAA